MEEKAQYKVEKAELCFWMALAHLQGMHPREKMEVAVKCFNLQRNLSDFFKADDSQKQEVYGVDAKYISKLNECSDTIPSYAFMAESLLEQGYDIITVRDSDYPRQLKKNLRYDSPLVIYTKGDNSLLNKEAVAIVGSRKAGAKSLAFTDTISKMEASQGKVVVSGYAKGVDRQALESALSVDGYSIAVLPQGITTFASGYKRLYKFIIRGHVLVMSYFLPTAGWSVGLAMARNTVVYALAHKIYVAESDSKGGTWSGVTAGLNRQRNNHEDISIYVRVPEDGEKNANKELIAYGAKAVNADGKEVPRSEIVVDMEKITEETISLLKRHEMRPKDVVTALKLNWKDSQMTNFLNSLTDKGVVKERKGRYNVYTVNKQTQLSLFG